MKTKRMRERAAKLVEDKPMSSTQIQEQLNKGHHGITMQTLGNVLSKHPDIVKLGTVSTIGSKPKSSYQVCLWVHRNYIEKWPKQWQRQELAKIGCVPL